MPTFGEWERAVLTEAFDEVDFISAHAYYEPADGDLASFLASGVDMDAFIADVIEIADAVAAERGSDKRMAISFDEWNVWYISHGWEAGTEDWPVAPRLLEDVYCLADAVVVGDLLITLLRHADRVRAASLAQLVNVIAPIMTEPGGAAWRQTTFYPFALTSGNVGSVVLAGEPGGPTVVTAKYGDVPAVNAVVTWDEANSVTIFAVNRDLENSHAVAWDLAAMGTVSGAEVTVLAGNDLLAANTASDPDRVTPTSGTAAVSGTQVTCELPPASWTMLRVRLS